MTDYQQKKYALVSVYDKTGIVDFVKTLTLLNYSIISTGGTAKILSENNISVIPIQEITGNPESFDGRIKTISFEVESGILFDRNNPEHIKQASEFNIKPIDIVVCNLYPFTQKPSVENIDVGGPTMIRAAAKNFQNVIVVIDPHDYKNVTEILNKKDIDLKTKQELASKAFYHLSLYDSQIARFFNTELFPNELTLPLKKSMNLRYGENPHQQAAVYLDPQTHSPFRNLQKLWGRDLSYTNITDINAGIESVKLFSQPAAVVIKHNNPCGIALGNSPKQALERAIEADPESAFGGVIVTNHPMDTATAKIIASFKDERKGNIDIVAIPHIENETLALLKNVRKSMGIYTFDSIKSESAKDEGLYAKWINGGMVIQTLDNQAREEITDWKVVTKKKPSEKQMEQMKLAWKFISRIKSNAIIIVDKTLPMTRGIGTGQTSRVRSVKIALEQAGGFAKEAVLASDGFFPFSDSVEHAAKKGISAIIQPGGSINDSLSIRAADKDGLVMVFTGTRAFWH